MTRFYDDEDVRVQADKLHENTMQQKKWLDSKGRQACGAKQDKKARMLRDQRTRDDIGFRVQLALRARSVPVTLPKVSDKC